MVHQLKVTLAGVTPMAWRRLQVRSATTLAELHEVLQVAMGWENCHLHAFEIGGAPTVRTGGRKPSRSPASPPTRATG